MSKFQSVRLVLPRFRNHRGRLTVRNEGRAPAPVLAVDVRLIVLCPAHSNPMHDLCREGKIFQAAAAVSAAALPLA